MDVTAFSERDAFAVGSVHEDGAVHTLILRWNGARWIRVPSPNRSDTRNYLTGVAGSSPSDVWAVGWDVDANGRHRALALHWNGALWRVVPVPEAGTIGSLLTDVVAPSPADAWAVGSATVEWPLQGRTLALHWDGRTWEAVPSPSPSDTGVGSNFLGVGASAHDDVWGVGDVDKGDYVMGTLVERWDGSRWSVVPSPSAPDGALLDAVEVQGSDDVWAVGWWQSSSMRPLALHWDGHRWADRELPVPADDASLADVVVTDEGAWVVGVRYGSDGSRTLAAHWNGRTFEVMSTVDPGSHGNNFAGIAAIPGTSCLWAVGQWTDGEIGAALIERYCG